MQTEQSDEKLVGMWDQRTAWWVSGGRATCTESRKNSCPISNGSRSWATKLRYGADAAFAKPRIY